MTIWLRYLRQVLLGAGTAASLLTAQMAAADAEDCRTHDKLVTLVISAQNFENYLVSGSPPNAPLVLQNYIDQNSPVSIRMALRKANIDQLDSLVNRILVHHRSLLQVLNQSGRSKAYASSVRLKAPHKVASLREQLMGMPCAAEGFGDITVTGESAERKYSSAVAASSLMSVSALVVIGLIIFEWRRLARARRDRRRDCNLPCTLTVANRTHHGDLVDISTLGAKISTDGACHPGDTVAMRLANLNLMVEVIWANSGHAGVQFRTPLPSDIIDNLVRMSEGLPSEPIEVPGTVRA